jgi:hypothetical protein
LFIRANRNRAKRKNNCSRRPMGDAGIDFANNVASIPRFAQ